MYRRRSHLPFWLEILAGIAAAVLYRVRVRGAERMPARGGAVLIANHLSYVDVVALQVASPRPLRFIGYRGDEAHGFFDWIFGQAGVIPISARRPGAGFRRAVRALEAGEVLCVFPEGSISRTGQLMRLHRGFAAMAAAAKVPVIPAAVDGLWGSVFSFAGRRYLWKSPRLLPTPVCVAFGAPLPATGEPVAAARRALLELGAEAFAERPLLRRHLGREVVRALAREPGRIAVTDCTFARRPVSAARLLGAAASLGRWLRATEAETRIGIVLPPGAGAAIANLAVLCAGKIPVNLNFTAGRESLTASLRLAGIRTILSAEAMREKAPQFPWPERTLDLRAVLAEAGGPRAMLPWIAAAWLLPNQWVADLLGLPRRGDRAEAALLFTSGSSGEPKGVVLTHRNLLANAVQISSLCILPRSCKMLGCLPLFHSFGFTVSLWYPLLRRCELVTVPNPLDTRKMIDTIREEAVTVLIGPPTFLRPIMKKARPADLRSLDLVVAGAEKLPDDLRREFLARLHLDLIEGYGLTETAPVASVNQPDPPVTTATADPQPGQRAGTVGRLLPGMAARIVHPETGVELPATETGVIWLRGENVFAGYLGEARRNAEVLRDGWFITGDLGRFDEDGFLTIAGRLSRFSKIGGEMVPHGGIEESLAAAFALDLSEGPLAAIMGVPDAGKGEALVLLAAFDVTAEEVRERLLAAGLPNLWIPKRVLRVEKIPQLAAGKLDLAGCQRLAVRL